jgi:hypothetical protein
MHVSCRFRRRANRTNHFQKMRIPLDWRNFEGKIEKFLNEVKAHFFPPKFPQSKRGLTVEPTVYLWCCRPFHNNIQVRIDEQTKLNITISVTMPAARLPRIFTRYFFNIHWSVLSTSGRYNARKLYSKSGNKKRRKRNTCTSKALLSF